MKASVERETTMTTEKNKAADEAQSRQLMDDWARAVRAKDANDMDGSNRAAVDLTP